MVRSRWMSVVLAALVAFALAAAGPVHAEEATSNVEAKAAPQKTLRVLTIGNSFTRNATRYLEDIIKADGRFELILGRAWIGGASFERHWTAVAAFEANPEDPKGKPYGGKSLKELLASQAWDIVTVQQYSWESDKIDSYRPFAKSLVDYVRKHVPKAQVWLHETWAYRADDDNKLSRDYPQQKMHANLRAAYHEIARELDIRDILPVGDAFQKARGRDDYTFRYPDPDFDYKKPVHPNLPDQAHSLNVGWYWKKGKDGEFSLAQDTHHANKAGEYLGGAVWFERLFGASVVGNTFVPEGVSADEVKILQQVAHDTVAEEANNHPAASPAK